MSRIRKGSTPNFGFVYFLVAQSGKSLICKIGFTGCDVWKRVRQIQACSPLELDIFGYVPGSVALERRFHGTFAPVRLHGEWFHATGKLYDFLWALSGYGAANRPTTIEEALMAVSDVILAEGPPHPSVDAAQYAASANPEHWEQIFA